MSSGFQPSRSTAKYTRLPSAIEETLNNCVFVSGITIKAMNLEKQSMYDVFAHYTGKELRDAETEKGYEVSLRTRGH
jgi:hypothetical protein